jgi:peroxiredoxin-like protein
MSEEHRFAVTATWNAATREGAVGNGGPLSLVHDGATSLGGGGRHGNPEELLLSAVSTCFVQTWAIFLAKLKVPIENPVVDAMCVVAQDPAGGFRVAKIEIHPRVPAALLAERRADVDKTLFLAEKYCIVSKAVRGEGKDFTVVATPA